MKKLYVGLVHLLVWIFITGAAHSEAPDEADPGTSTLQTQDYKPTAAELSITSVVAQLKVELEQLKSRQQIHDLYVRYMRGFDRSDIELMRSTFWPDAQINYGTQLNTFNEFVADHLEPQKALWAHYAHLITNEFVEIDGDVAHVETYVTEFISTKYDQSMIFGGRYIDRLDRRNGEWRIAVREFIPHFGTQTSTAIDSHLEKGSRRARFTGCGLGTLDRRDPSYLRPLNRRTSKEESPECAK